MKCNCKEKSPCELQLDEGKKTNIQGDYIEDCLVCQLQTIEQGLKLLKRVTDIHTVELMNDQILIEIPPADFRRLFGEREKESSERSIYNKMKMRIGAIEIYCLIFKGAE